jgi:hypothetical protein
MPHEAPCEPRNVEDQPPGRERQRPLFAGLDCLPGQLDLFPTDGAPDNGRAVSLAEPSETLSRDFSP